MDTPSLQGCFEGPSGEVFSDEVDQIFGFIDSIEADDVGVLEGPKHGDLVLQCFLPQELYFLPFLREHFGSTSFPSVSMLHQVNGSEGSSPQPFQRLIELVESFVVEQPSDFPVQHINCFNIALDLEVVVSLIDGDSADPFALKRGDDQTVRSEAIKLLIWRRR